MIRKRVIAAVLLLLLTNIVVLAGVAYNRSGDDVVSLVLTERELSLQRKYSASNENSGQHLSLQWQSLSDYSKKNQFRKPTRWNPFWLTEDKLKALGVDVDAIKAEYTANKDSSDYRRRSLSSANAIMVLEFNGDSYKEAVASAKEGLDKEIKNPQSESGLEREKRDYERAKIMDTRLYVIDAGVDRESLLQKYNDSSKYILMRGEIRPFYDETDKKVQGRLIKLFVSKIHVPLPYSKLIDNISRTEQYTSYSSDPVPPNYKVNLKFGKRLEPWITSVEAINQ